MKSSLLQILPLIPSEAFCLPAKTTLLSAGETASKVFFIKEGCVRLWYNNDGKDITVQFFMPGSMVASFESFFKETPSEFSIETILPTTVAVYDKKDIEEYRLSHPGQLDIALDFAIDRARNYIHLFLSRIKDTPQQRYKDLLEEAPEIVASIPQHYIASYLGITSVSLSRIRKRLSQE